MNLPVLIPDGVGFPAFKPTKEVLDKIEEMASVGFSQQEIAEAINIAPETLTRKKKIFSQVREAIRRGKSRAAFFLAHKTFQNATTATKLNPGGNPSDRQFLLERRFGWKQELKVQGDPENPIQVKIILPTNGRDRTIDQ
jgi:hypothetical protein